MWSISQDWRHDCPQLHRLPYAGAAIACAIFQYQREETDAESAQPPDWDLSGCRTPLALAEEQKVNCHEAFISETTPQEGVSPHSSRLVGICGARLYDTDLMIGKFHVPSGKRDSRHVATHTIRFRDWAGFCSRGSCCGRSRMAAG